MFNKTKIKMIFFFFLRKKKGWCDLTPSDHQENNLHKIKKHKKLKTK